MFKPKTPISGRLDNSSGAWIRTKDLRVMSPSSCHCSTPHRLSGLNYSMYDRAASSSKTGEHFYFALTAAKPFLMLWDRELEAVGAISRLGDG